LATTGGDGGALSYLTASGTLSIGSTMFISNSAGGNGGAISATAYDMFMTGGYASGVLYNTAHGAGGGIYNGMIYHYIGLDALIQGNLAGVGTPGGAYASGAETILPPVATRSGKPSYFMDPWFITQNGQTIVL
jgi:predicted outer membrane repeat protein